jgi:hypothetical protein
LVVIVVSIVVAIQDFLVAIQDFLVVVLAMNILIVDSWGTVTLVIGLQGFDSW